MNVETLGPSFDDKSQQEIQASHACHAVSLPGVPTLLMPCHRGELIGHPATFQVGLLLQTMLTLCPLLIPPRRASLEFAADIASKVLPAYEAAFGVPYSMPKLDLVAIPDFSAGAMENWGASLCPGYCC